MKCNCAEDRAHFLICMLARHVEMRMREALTPILFDDKDGPVRDSPVAKAERSQQAKRKAAAKRTSSGKAVHGFRGLLAHLGTPTMNRIEPPGTESRGSSHRIKPHRVNVEQNTCCNLGAVHYFSFPSIQTTIDLLTSDLHAHGSFMQMMRSVHIAQCRPAKRASMQGRALPRFPQVLIIHFKGVIHASPFFSGQSCSNFGSSEAVADHARQAGRIDLLSFQYEQNGRGGTQQRKRPDPKMQQRQCREQHDPCVKKHEFCGTLGFAPAVRFANLQCARHFSCGDCSKK